VSERASDEDKIITEYKESGGDGDGDQYSWDEVGLGTMVVGMDWDGYQIFYHVILRFTLHR